MASDNNLVAMADRLNLTFCRDHIEEIISETTILTFHERQYETTSTKECKNVDLPCKLQMFVNRYGFTANIKPKIFANLVLHK